MVVRELSRIITGFFGLVNHIQKFFPLAIPKQYSEFASTPAFNAFIFACNLFKLIEQFLDFFRLHIASVVMVASCDRLIFRGVLSQRAGKPK